MGKGGWGGGGGRRAQTRCILGAVQVANKRVPKDNHNSERLDYKSLEPLSHASKFLFVRFVNTTVNHEHSVSNCHFAVGDWSKSIRWGGPEKRGGGS